MTITFDKDVLRRMGISQSEWSGLTTQERIIRMEERILRDGQKREWRAEMPDEPLRQLK